MEVSEGLFWGCAVCTLATALYVWLWEQGGGCLAGLRAAAMLALEGQLYIWGYHGLFGALTMCCCFAVHCLIRERSKFLSMHGKSVLITGRVYFS